MNNIYRVGIMVGQEQNFTMPEWRGKRHRQKIQDWNKDVELISIGDSTYKTCHSFPLCLKLDVVALLVAHITLAKFST